jgi:DNA-binding response OmpR family regulator
MSVNSQILIVDDDPDICTMIKMVLEYHGFAGIEADNEEKVDKILSSQHIDLIIMDMLLSGADGTDICRRIKNDKEKSSLPVLMFSAHPTARETCLAAGADDFIPKPFEMNDLIARVNFFIERKPVKQD